MMTPAWMVVTTICAAGSFLAALAIGKRLFAHPAAIEAQPPPASSCVPPLPPETHDSKRREIEAEAALVRVRRLLPCLDSDRLREVHP